MIWLYLEAKAETPVALPQRAEAGNLYESLPEIPGTAVRGAFASKYINQNGIPSKDDKVFVDLFEKQKIRFGPLRPIPKDICYGINLIPMPVPRSARSCKYDSGFKDHGVIDSLVHITQSNIEKQEDDHCSIETREKEKCQYKECKAPLEPLDSNWMISYWDNDFKQGNAFDYDSPLNLNTHVGIGPANYENADMAEEGRLFSLEHFPAGTKFRGWIVLNEDRDIENLGFEKVNDIYKIDLRVGRRSHTYGAINVEIIAQSDAPWKQSHRTIQERFEHFTKTKDQITKNPFCDNADYDLFSITCLTDLILLDDFLRPCRSISASQLAKWLKLNEFFKDSIKKLSAFTNTRLISGWNTAHRLPKENDIAIVAGSVFLFAIKKDQTINLVEKLKDLEENGVGWRRSEGFGQVLICDPFHNPDACIKPIPQKKDDDKKPQEIKFDPDVFKFLEENINALRNDSITKSQIGGLRDRIQRYHLAYELKRKQQKTIEKDELPQKYLKDFLEHAEERSKNGCWDTKMKDGTLANELIKLFGLSNNTDWIIVKNRAEQFTKGALLIIATKKPEKLLNMKSFLDEKEGEK